MQSGLDPPHPHIHPFNCKLTTQNQMKRSKLHCPEVVMPSYTVDPQFTTTPYTDATQTKKHPPNHIKRPMNAFMVWSMLHRRKIIANNPDAHNATISKNLGQLWTTLSSAEKQPFKEEAKRLKIYHKLEYPEYIFKPKPRQRKIQGTHTEMQMIPTNRFDSTPEVRVDIQFSFQAKARNNQSYNIIREIKANAKNVKRKPSIDTITIDENEDDSSSMATKDDTSFTCQDKYFVSHSLGKGYNERYFSTREQPSMNCTQCIQTKLGHQKSSMDPLDLMHHEQQSPIHSRTPWQGYMEPSPQSKQKKASQHNTLEHLWQHVPNNQNYLRGGYTDNSYRTYLTKEDTNNVAKYHKASSSNEALSMGHDGDLPFSNNGSTHFVDNMINREDYMDNCSSYELRNKFNRSRRIKTQTYKANMWESSNYKDDGLQVETTSDLLDSTPQFNYFSQLDNGEYRDGHMEKAYDQTNHIETTSHQEEDTENVYHGNSPMKNYLHHAADTQNVHPQTETNEDSYDDTNNVCEIYDEIDNMENMYNQTDNLEVELYQANKTEHPFLETDMENNFDQTDDMNNAYNLTDDFENVFEKPSTKEKANDQPYNSSQIMKNGSYEVNDMENIFHQTDYNEAFYDQYKNNNMDKVDNQIYDMENLYDQSDDLQNSLLRSSNTLMDTFSSFLDIVRTTWINSRFDKTHC